MLLRDSKRLNHRFVDRPAVTYTLVQARVGGEPLGLAVLRDNSLCEWVVPPERVDVAGALVAWCDEYVRASHSSPLASPLETSFPETCPEWLLFQRLGFRIQGGHDYTCFRSFHKPYVMSWLFHHWYYTPSDLGQI